MAACRSLTSDTGAVHLHALVAVPVSSAFTVTVFGGPRSSPSLRTWSTDIASRTANPFDDAAFAGVGHPGAVGVEDRFNVGADVAY